MADLLAKGSAFLASKLGIFAAHSVAYARKGAAAITIQATVGRTTHRIDQDGVRLRIETRDFLCAPSDLGSLGKPVEGDTITEVINGVSTTYEVMAPGGEPCWRWSSTNHDRYRIHTTRIS